MINTTKNELLLFIKGYLAGEYPCYILKNKQTSEIPIFIYHHISLMEFEERLQYLSRNKYNTLTADELELSLNDRTSAPERSVVITFDDGLSDVYEVAFPLLKKYQLKIVVFLLPGWIGKSGVLTWNQVQEMHNSGLVDFQSHSMNHTAIFTSPELFDFYNPKYSNMKPWNFPLPQTEKGEKKFVPNSWGAPLYKFHSRFSDSKKYFTDKNIRRLCVEHVAKNGNEEFFEQTNWRGELKAIVNDYQKNNSGDNKFESEKEQEQSILEELRLSKRTIEEKLQDKTIRHFAWPWNQVGVLTARLLVKSGYTTSYMGLTKGDIDDSEINDINLNLIRRVTGDFIICLPGEGRQSFWSVMLRKIIRRFKSGATY